ncbi:MAG: patatin-like phospholipase family protein [Actinomycetota bacterium]
MTHDSERSVAFVLGGGGVLGANEVGMLRALLEADIVPDVILGTSIGAVNGAVLASDPTTASVERLTELWISADEAGIFSGGMLARLGTLARTRTHAHPNEPLRQALERALPVRLIEELAVPFQCVAASIERSAEHWFTEGSIVDAVLASSAVPGLLPPVELGDENFFDGGLVNSIPVDRAVAMGATTIFVLQVGRIEQPLTKPTKPWEVALVAFEIARRHRFARQMSDLPESVEVHVLPTGEDVRFNDLSQLRYRNMSRTAERIERAYEVSASFLEGIGASSE